MQKDDPLIKNIRILKNKTRKTLLDVRGVSRRIESGLFSITMGIQPKRVDRYPFLLSRFEDFELCESSVELAFDMYTRLPRYIAGADKQPKTRVVGNVYATALMAGNGIAAAKSRLAKEVNIDADGTRLFNSLDSIELFQGNLPRRILERYGITFEQLPDYINQDRKWIFS